MNILIFGSSITWGAWDEKGGWAQRIKTDADADARASSLNQYNAVYCLGVSGDTTVGLLERFNTEVKARVDENEELLIVVEIGINDSQLVLAENKSLVTPEEYQNNLIKLIEKAKNYGAKVVFVGLTPVDERVEPIPWAPESSYKLGLVEKYDAILKKVCSEHNSQYIEVMSKFPKDKYKSLLLDGVHPTTEGHRVIYEEVKKQLALL